MNFDEIIDRRNTHSAKWDKMETLYGVSPRDGIAMWVADMDFRPPQCVADAVSTMQQHGVYGYFGGDDAYKGAIQWWMQTRHNWAIQPEWIFTTHGLVNGTGICVDTFTAEGDGVVLFTPVYHAFSRVIAAAGRNVVECDLVNNAGRYEFDFESYDAQMTGSEKMVILCSPHNPGGRVWTKAELAGVAAFAKRHDLILVSDEIHHDLVFDGHTHIPMAHIEGITDRLVMMTAPSKTFNIAGNHTGNVIIEDPDLRSRFARRMGGLGMSPNSFGLFMNTAAYSPEGAKWLDALVPYLDGNRKLFDAAVNAIPGVASMTLESTYLSWVDFSGTGMDKAEFTRRVNEDAKLAVNFGETFGSGGGSFLRFNIATPRSVVSEACDRLSRAFADLQ